MEENNTSSSVLPQLYFSPASMWFQGWQSSPEQDKKLSAEVDSLMTGISKVKITESGLENKRDLLRH